MQGRGKPSTAIGALMVAGAICALAGPARGEQAGPSAGERLEALEERVEALAERDEQLAREAGAPARELEERIRALEGRLEEMTLQVGAAAPGEPPIEARLGEQGRLTAALERSVEAAAVAQQEAAASPWVSYGAADGFVVRPPGQDYQLLVRGWIWARYDGGGVVSGGEVRYTNNFSIPESRLRFTGVMWGGRIQVVLEPSVALGRPGLQDGYVELRLHPLAWLRVGQMLVPYDWETNTAPPVLPLAGHGSVTRYFWHTRDLGLMLTGNLGTNRFHYRIGLFNGTGRGNSNDNPNPMVALMGRLQILGTSAAGWSWVDLDRSSEPNLGLGFGFTFDHERVTSGETSFEQGVYQVYADLALRWHGLSVVGAAHYRATDLGQGADDLAHSYGWFVHLGYTVWARHLELLARYSEVDPSTDLDGNTGREITGGLTLFLVGHQAKLTALYAYQREMPGLPAEAEAHLAQVQVQGWF